MNQMKMKLCLSLRPSKIDILKKSLMISMQWIIFYPLIILQRRTPVINTNVPFVIANPIFLIDKI